jgi:hypothetical protein
MSSFRNIKINCPDCNTEGAYTAWDSVNVDLNPELKSKVMEAPFLHGSAQIAKRVTMLHILSCIMI